MKIIVHRLRINDIRVMYTLNRDFPHKLIVRFHSLKDLYSFPKRKDSQILPNFIDSNFFHPKTSICFLSLKLPCSIYTLFKSAHIN